MPIGELWTNQRPIPPAIWDLNKPKAIACSTRFEGHDYYLTAVHTRMMVFAIVVRVVGMNDTNEHSNARAVIL
jgi:hypothetical protein